MSPTSLEVVFVGFLRVYLYLLLYLSSSSDIKWSTPLINLKQEFVKL
jgi:hypothetical protein